MPPPQENVENRAESEDVGSRVERRHVAALLLGRHVPRSAENGARRLGGSAQSLRQPPVHHEDLSERADHDVLGLEVAMQDAAVVRERDRLDDALKDAEPLGEGRLGCGERVETRPFDEFHRVEDPAVGKPPDVVNGRDAGVLEPRQDPRFACEA